MRVVIFAVCLSWSGLAIADGESPPSEPRPYEGTTPPYDLPGWRLELRPYAFLPANTSGDVTVRDMQVPVDISLSDILDTLQFIGQVRLEAWHRRFGVILDSTYSQAMSATTAPGGVDLVLSNRTWVGSALAGYQVLATPHATFEVDAGVRVVWLDSRLMVARAMTVDSQRWPVFGVIGARVPIRLSPQWVVGARGDLALPDFDWSLTGGAEWDLSKIWTLGFGYRYEHIDHAGARPTVQLHSHGPYVGVGFRFGSGPVY